MAKTDPIPTLVIYRPKKGKEKELQELVEKHWPILNRVGLVTKDPAKVWRAQDKRSGDVFFVEMFSWKDGEAPDIAHQTPEVMSMWEPMGAIMEGLQLATIESI
jgi:hypothetical protein